MASALEELLKSSRIERDKYKKLAEGGTDEWWTNPEMFWRGGDPETNTGWGVYTIGPDGLEHQVGSQYFRDLASAKSAEATKLANQLEPIGTAYIAQNTLPQNIKQRLISGDDVQGWTAQYWGADQGMPSHFQRINPETRQVETYNAAGEYQGSDSLDKRSTSWLEQIAGPIIAAGALYTGLGAAGMLGSGTTAAAAGLGELGAAGLPLAEQVGVAGGAGTWGGTAASSYAPGMLGSGTFFEGIPTGLESVTGTAPSVMAPWSATPAIGGTGAGAIGMLGGATDAMGNLIGAGTAVEGATQLASMGITPEVIANASPSMLKQISDYTGLSEGALGKIASTGLGMLGSAIQGNAALGAAQTSANAQIEAARIAADAAKFRPVGVTTRFGSSQFQKDANGNIIGAGYQLSPEMKAQQDALMGISQGALSQYGGAQTATAPMGQAAGQMMTLGQGYLATSPQEQAAKYMAEQQALLGTGRERDLATLQNKLMQQGRLGLATGGTSTGMMAANPEMEAFYNEKRQQDLELAARATQGGQQYATYGAGMVGAGGKMLGDMYGTQTAAYDPYKTALGGAETLERLGERPMSLGIDIGAKGTTQAAQAGLLTAQGMQGAAKTMQDVNKVSPWGTMLTSGAQALQQYNQPVLAAGTQPTYDPGRFRLQAI